MFKACLTADTNQHTEGQWLNAPVVCTCFCDSGTSAVCRTALASWRTIVTYDSLAQTHCVISIALTFVWVIKRTVKIKDRQCCSLCCLRLSEGHIGVKTVGLARQTCAQHLSPLLNPPSSLCNVNPKSTVISCFCIRASAGVRVQI